MFLCFNFNCTTIFLFFHAHIHPRPGCRQTPKTKQNTAACKIRTSPPSLLCDGRQRLHPGQQSVISMIFDEQKRKEKRYIITHGRCPQFKTAVDRESTSRAKAAANRKLHIKSDCEKTTTSKSWFNKTLVMKVHKHVPNLNRQLFLGAWFVSHLARS